MTLAPQPAGDAPIGVLVVDDNIVVRHGLRVMLDAAEGIQVVAEAGNGADAVRQARAHRPAVVLLDVQMPGSDGVSVLPELVALSRVVMLTLTDEPAVVRAAVASGARGYLVHGAFDSEGLVAAVRSVAAGAALFSPAAVEVLQDVALRAPGFHPVPGGDLTSRQREIMHLVSQGRSNREIAEHLVLSEKTVKNHVNHIFAGLQVRTRAEAIAVWLGVGGRPVRRS